jgi:hypothetical protein
MELILKRHCIGRAPDTRTLQCNSISEYPTQYAEDKAADGNIMPSRIERPLVAKGISASEVNALEWEATHAQYEDPRTGERKEFALHGGHRVIEPNTAVFDIDYSCH